MLKLLSLFNNLFSRSTMFRYRSVIISLLLFISQPEIKLRAAELKHNVPIQRIEKNSPFYGTYSNIILAGANQPTSVLDSTKNYKGFGQSIYLNGYFSAPKVLVSYERNTLDSNHQNLFEYTATVQRVKISYAVSPAWLTGLGIESFSSHSKLKSVATELNYNQPLFILMRRWSGSWLSLQLAPRYQAELKKIDSSSGAVKAPDAEISSAINAQYLRNFYNLTLFFDLTIDTTDAIAEKVDKPNKVLRHRYVILLRQTLSRFYWFDVAFLRNRDLLMNSNVPFTHPHNAIGLATNLQLAPSTAIRLGLTSDLGGWLNKSGRKTRRLAFIFGFDYER